MVETCKALSLLCSGAWSIESLKLGIADTPAVCFSPKLFLLFLHLVEGLQGGLQHWYIALLAALHVGNKIGETNEGRVKVVSTVGLRGTVTLFLCRRRQKMLLVVQAVAAHCRTTVAVSR